MAEEILDDDLNPIDKNSDYDATSEFEESYSLKRITFKSLMGFVLSILNFEKGILFSIKELILRPRIVIEEYLKKDRKKLVNPIRFLVFSTALATFLSIILINNNPQFNSFNVGFSEGLSKSAQDSTTNNNSLLLNTLQDSTEVSEANLKLQKKEKLKKLILQLPELAKNSADKITFIMVFFLAFFTFIFFRKTGFNFTENLVVNSYAISVSNIFSILAFLPSWYSNSTLFITISAILSFLFVIYFWMMVYNRKSIGGFFRSVLVYLFSYLSFMIISGIAGFTYALIAMS